jgi:hypothetical protein
MGSIVFLPMSDSKLLDEQAGFEKGMQWLLAGASGINLIWGAGMVEGHTLWSNAQLVIDAEMCGMVGRYVEGVGVSDESIALDVIRDVGHFPNSYLDTEHTYHWWRGERYLPWCPRERCMTYGRIWVARTSSREPQRRLRRCFGNTIRSPWMRKWTKNWTACSRQQPERKGLSRAAPAQRWGTPLSPERLPEDLRSVAT